MHTTVKQETSLVGWHLAPSSTQSASVSLLSSFKHRIVLNFEAEQTAHLLPLFCRLVETVQKAVILGDAPEDCL
jgi:hypothetical protein